MGTGHGVTSSWISVSLTSRHRYDPWLGHSNSFLSWAWPTQHRDIDREDTLLTGKRPGTVTVIPSHVQILWAVEEGQDASDLGQGRGLEAVPKVSILRSLCLH